MLAFTKEGSKKHGKATFLPSLFWAVSARVDDALSLSRDLSSTLTYERPRKMRRVEECTTIWDGMKGEGLLKEGRPNLCLSILPGLWPVRIDERV